VTANDEVKSVGNEAAVDYFKLLNRHLLGEGEAEENNETPQNSRPPK